MAIEVRPLGDDETAWTRLSAVDGVAFYNEPPERTVRNDGNVMELDRSVLAYDGTTAVGCASALSLELSVPGGTLPTAGVTWVGVTPTNRRRGVMTALMRAVHDDTRERGREPLLALWASQGSLYQRFGYGVAAHSYLATIPHHLRLAHAPSARPHIEPIPVAEDRSRVQAVYRRMRRERPGMPVLDDAWYERNSTDSEQDREGASPLQTYVVSTDSEDVGYVRLRYKSDWSSGFADGTVRVLEMVAVTPQAAATIYDLLLGSDLMRRTTVWNMALDDPALIWLDDPSQVELCRRDQLYIRLGDVAALAQRAYCTDLDVVIEVHDRFHAWNAGRWQLHVSGGESTCERTDADADVTTDVSVLSAAFLGSSRWGAMHVAGQVDEHRAGTVLRLDAAFGWPRAAWCPFVF